MYGPVASMLAEYQVMRSRLADLQAAAAQVSAAVRAPDRSVTVTVGPHGELQDLRIDPVIAAQLDPRTLSHRILGAARLATAQTREQVRVMTRAALPEPMRDLVRSDGSIDLLGLLPADPDEAGWGRQP
jgi:DNA-binding protein YbaB